MNTHVVPRSRRDRDRVIAAAHGGAREAAGDRRPTDVAIASRLVAKLGGRYATELGIETDAGEAQVERWFLAATLFGTRISANLAEQTFRVLESAGLSRIDQVRHVSPDELIALLDAGGYARYDFRTATRLAELAEVVDERYDGQVGRIGRRFGNYPDLRAALYALPGWGPVTVQLFLRELRGVWPGADPPLAEHAVSAARHLRLDSHLPLTPSGLAALAAAAGLDPRDLEAALVRLDLSHRRTMARCRGGRACTGL